MNYNSSHFILMLSMSICRLTQFKLKPQIHTDTHRYTQMNTDIHSANPSAVNIRKMKIPMLLNCLSFRILNIDFSKIC